MLARVVVPRDEITRLRKSVDKLSSDMDAAKTARGEQRIETAKMAQCLDGATRRIAMIETAITTATQHVPVLQTKVAMIERLMWGLLAAVVAAVVLNTLKALGIGT